MSTTVYNWKKEKTGTIDLDPTVFGITPRIEILHEVVRWQLASRRQGTHMVKTRSLVSGGGKKPFKQKGTGNARQGSTRSPLMPGGAKLFGPVPRDYSWSLPKKVRKLGLRMALSQLNATGKLFIVDDMKSDGKTGGLAKQMKAFGLEKSVLVDVGTNDKAAQAARNLTKFKFLAIEGVNVFDLLKYDAVVMTKQSVTELATRLQAEA